MVYVFLIYKTKIKNMKKLLFVVIASMALFSACKKKDVEKTTAEKILGKWTLVTETYNDYYNNTSHITTYPGSASDIIDFRTDGRVYDGPNGTSSSSYSVISDTKLSVDGVTTDINALTDNQLILHAKIPGVGTDYDEYTSTYRR
jgi:hypothetical protein